MISFRPEVQPVPLNTNMLDIPSTHYPTVLPTSSSTVGPTMDLPTLQHLSTLNTRTDEGSEFQWAQINIPTLGPTLVPKVTKLKPTKVPNPNRLASKISTKALKSKQPTKQNH
jgi:hypothetical protein